MPELAAIELKVEDLQALAAAREAVLERTGAQATYSSYPVLSVKETRTTRAAGS